MRHPGSTFEGQTALHSYAEWQPRRRRANRFDQQLGVSFLRITMLGSSNHGWTQVGGKGNAEGQALMHSPHSMQSTAFKIFTNLVKFRLFIG